MINFFLFFLLSANALDAKEDARSENAATYYFDAVKQVQSIITDPAFRSKASLLSEAVYGKFDPSRFQQIQESFQPFYQALAVFRVGTKEKKCEFPQSELAERLDQPIPYDYEQCFNIFCQLILLQGKKCAYEKNFNEAIQEYLQLLRFSRHLKLHGSLLIYLNGLRWANEALAMFGELILNPEFASSSLPIGEIQKLLLEEGLIEKVVIQEKAASIAYVKHTLSASTPGAISAAIERHARNWDLFIQLIHTRGDDWYFSEFEKLEFDDEDKFSSILNALKSISSPRKIQDARSKALFVGLQIMDYRRMKGATPDRLDLVIKKEDFLDPFSGKPLHYKRTEKSFVLYSVGKNGKDDGASSSEDLILLSDAK